MDQLTVLKRKRGIFKAQITKFDSFISSFTHDKIVELQVRVDKCKEWWNDFDQIQSEIDLLDTSEEQLQERLDFQDAYFKLIASAEIILKNEVNLNETIANSGHNTSLDRNSLKNVRLPPLEVPTFNGCYQHWLEFRDSFTSMVIENSDLNDVDKLHYLKRALIGDAQDELEQLKTTSKNFTIAWQLLSETYEKKKLIARGHIEAIYEYPKITQVNSLELKKLSGCIKRNLKSLGMLGYPVEHWDVLLLCTIEKKLDYYTNKEWQEKGPVNEFSTIQEFLAFIDHKVQHLQNSEKDKQDIEQISKETKKRVQKMTLSKSFIATSKQCALCNLPHYFYSCKKFHNLSVSARRQEVTKSKACWNCLKDGHLVQHCTWGGCKLCGKRHNTLLHMDGKFINNSHLQTNATQLNGSKVESQICGISTQKETHTQGNGISNQGKEVHIQGQGAFHNNSMEGTSQLNFLGQTGFLESHSGDIGQTCFLESHSGDIGQDSINFLNHSKQGISYRLKTDILLSTALVYMQDKYGILHECRVLLDSGSQSNFISRSFFEKLQLRADKVHIPVKGLGQGITNISQALNGTLLSKFSNYQTNAFLLVIDKISDNLPTSDLNLDFINIPKNIVLADETFGVSKQIDVLLGASVFWQLLCVGQIKLGKDQPILQKTKLGWVISGPVSQSIKVSNNSVEYIQLGHMSKVEDKTDFNSETPNYYLPHHGVLKETSLTTKLRVVFDGSARTDSGLSLNDVLMVGPKLQDDLMCILLRFRKHNVVIASDIEKMYRQVFVCKTQQKLQQILWRFSDEQPIETYKLKTLTYGTAPAAFLAIRSLQQLAHENQLNLTLASQVILKDFYVDDLLTGGSSIEEVKSLKDELNNILCTAGFSLRKWVSNKPEIFDEDIQIKGDIEHYLADDVTTKTLGLYWNSKIDSLQYKINFSNYTKVSKRTVLSLVSQIFDPLGLVGPVIIKAKLIMQSLWQLKLNWDESLPLDLHTAWNQFRESIADLEKTHISRQVLCSNPINRQLHCFSDASESAYGAALYIRSLDQGGSCLVHLLCAKSRVAPLKTISLPRLELCGALLAAKLASEVIATIGVSFDEVHFWSDSMITLHWILGEPSQWKTFVGNRVSEIQRLSNGYSWHHVDSHDNPADIITRGYEPKLLNTSKLWWNGPPWLASHKLSWPTKALSNSHISIIPDQKDYYELVDVFKSQNCLLTRSIQSYSRTVMY
ncbi:uncharacterized protein [Diabrotica undecimpunctata]|uniref:uncharacterized protein n=1 Tax=Diabrotica undecimpunctata TaxID=50387 RepID=UPI003B63A89A